MGKNLKIKIKVKEDTVEIKASKATNDDIVDVILALKEGLIINGVNYNKIIADRMEDDIVNEMNKKLKR